MSYKTAIIVAVLNSTAYHSEVIILPLSLHLTYDAYFHPLTFCQPLLTPHSLHTMSSPLPPPPDPNSHRCSSLLLLSCVQYRRATSLKQAFLNKDDSYPASQQ